MSSNGCDLAIVGGGLAGGLIALAVSQRRPDVRLRLIEEGPAPGGNHRWSWFASDLAPAGQALLAPFVQTNWTGGYDVAFPHHRRHLPTPYRSLASADFAAHLRTALPPGTIVTGRAAGLLAVDGVALAGGERIAARAVIDCRGFVPTPHLTGGWQVFMGRHLKTQGPHGVAHPIIMDATVDQTDGYRFVYVLPLKADELFVEDTYYQDTPLLDRAKLTARLDAYQAAHGWQGETIGEEVGVLPVITGGDFATYQAQVAIPGVGAAGARGGFVHPLTSYTLPFAAQMALAIAAQADLAGPALAEMLAARGRAHWQATGFYRLLGSMLFGAAPPAGRHRVFGRFYTLSPALIERFYAARSTLADRARILLGRPPVPVGAALQALAHPRPPLYAPVNTPSNKQKEAA